VVLLLVVAVVAIACLGNRLAGALAALSAANGQYMSRFMLTPKPGAKPSQRARLVTVALAGLAGHAMGNSSTRAV
jgi:hypothetical protein